MLIYFAQHKLVQKPS